MLKRCVLTLVIGEEYDKMFEHTEYNMKMYSKKINADFLKLDFQEMNQQIKCFFSPAASRPDFSKNTSKISKKIRRFAPKFKQ